ncbi:hypothetical protein [Roseicitreum antarcticum]|uniref:Uncharacterized protein n=1 Tax=Roseicitreum antarcticum TaxID=564137 RepID=A0A1H3CRV5_9RHOB|nr:hypothetical protein [Roseicitreum antarcticum]SDX56139.1 hypothetical protein SAMN04488238_11013 [Roseicitreum antarcticum]
MPQTRAAPADAFPALAAPAHLPRQARLYIDVQHGLCNRLRAMASGAVIAQRLGRELVVVWRPDPHCEARLGDLLHYPGPVIEDDVADLLRAQSAQVYNYMEIEPGARFQEPILATGDVAGDVYIRSAYVLNSPHRDPALEERFLRRLVPSAPVRDLVSRVRRLCDVAVHIRMASGAGFEHLVHESPDNWPAHRHSEMVEWRKKSHADHFIARLDALRAVGGLRTIFLATDLAQTYARLAERYGADLVCLERDLYDRSTLQIQYALADLILLARCPRLLASSWSSFSDMAERLGPCNVLIERSGIDF